MAILLFAIYHIIEWLKVTCTLTVICVKQNIVGCIYVVTLLNTLYGIVICLYSMVVVFGEAGQMCCDTQWRRGWWLKTEIIAFWVFFFLYPGPFLPIRMLKKESHDYVLNKEDTDSEDEGEGEKEKEPSKGEAAGIDD